MRYSKQYHQRLVELWTWHKNFRGPGVRNSVHGVTFSPPPSQRSRPADPQPGGTLPLGQYQGMFYGMVSDNQGGFSDIFMIQGP